MLQASARATASQTRSASASEDDVLCVVVGVSAPVDVDGRTVLRHNPYWEAMNPDLVDRLRLRGQCVLVDNDVNLAATAEAGRGHAHGVQNHVTLMVDEGFGSLDLRSLDAALATLGDVAGGGKMVGLISHLKPVAESVETVLLVRKHDVLGSTIARLDDAGREDLLADDIRSGLTGG